MACRPLNCQGRDSCLHPHSGPNAMTFVPPASLCRQRLIKRWDFRSSQAQGPWCDTGRLQLHTGTTRFKTYRDFRQNQSMQKLGAQNKAAVKRYLNTGDYDPNERTWPGDNFIEVATNADTALREALIAQVLKRAPRHAQVPTPPIENLMELTRSKVLPMVTGLFPPAERPVIMKTLEASVIFLTPENIESTLRTSNWLGTTWDLANMYLLQRGLKPLSPEAPSIVGLSEETTCYLSLDYLADQSKVAFSDYLVHEAAHIFHNCRRCTIGLPETRTRRELLSIHFSKREMFAYACETYSRILLASDSTKGRRSALAQYSQGPLPSENEVKREEYLAILGEAVSAKNGWKRILLACAPSK